jgi:hypothetical protein
MAAPGQADPARVPLALAMWQNDDDFVPTRLTNGRRRELGCDRRAISRQFRLAAGL